MILLEIWLAASLLFGVFWALAGLLLGGSPASPRGLDPRRAPESRSLGHRAAAPGTEAQVEAA